MLMDINKIITEEYNDIISEYEKLGKGGFGKVFEKDGFVYKLTSSNNEIKITKAIMDIQKENNNILKTFPYINWIKISPNKKYFIVKRELLYPLSSKDNKIKNHELDYEIRQYINSNNSKNDYDKLKRIQSIFDLHDKYIDFIAELFDDINKINLNHYFDFHYNNIGLNKEGNYIMFDY